MSNRINIDAVHKPDSGFWGFNAYDGYSSCSAFNWEKLPEDDFDFLYAILTHENGYPEEFGEMMDFAEDNEQGVTIRDTYYDWEEIEETYAKAMAANKAQNT